MSKWGEARKIYAELPVPDNLSELVEHSIRQAEKEMKIKEKQRKLRIFRGCMLIPAACIACLILVLNTSEAFAMGVYGIPVLGDIARVLTVRSYTDRNRDREISVKEPAIEADTALSAEVNQAIQAASDAYIAGAKQRLSEYKEAFLATGGTEEEFARHQLAITVDYEVKCQREHMTSFVLYGTENWTSANAVTYYYNLDLESGRALTLYDLLGPDYVNIANRSIVRQMETRLESDPGLQYFDPKEGGFKTIDAGTKFYINQAGKPVVVFDAYEIAPGGMGRQEFVIE